MSYTPQPGSQSAKVLAVLQAMPGTEMTCAEIAGDVGCPSSSVHGLLSSAVRSGAARKLLREGRVYFVADKPAAAPVEAPPAAAQPVERDDAPIVQRVVPAAGAKALDLQRHPLDAAWHGLANAKETPQEGANRDASAGQSHDAAGSASPAGRGTNGASARGAAPVFLQAQDDLRDLPAEVVGQLSKAGQAEHARQVNEHDPEGVAAIAGRPATAKETAQRGAGSADIAATRQTAASAGDDAKPAVGAAAPEGFRCALWSNGALQIERGAATLALLSPDETRALVAYLERLAA